MRDSLGDRMKAYEAVSSGQLLRRCPVIVRVDGRAFHTWTRTLKMDRPIDLRMVDWMQQAAEYTAVRMQGCKLVFTQSDEASFLLTDYDKLETQPWFGYDLAKVVSLAASTFTAGFIGGMIQSADYDKARPDFDARAFNVPESDIANYFLWRAKDWHRNAVQMLAQSMFSPKQLHGVKLDAVQEMIQEKVGRPWDDWIPREVLCGGWFLPQQLEWVTVTSANPSFSEVSLVVELAMQSAATVTTAATTMSTSVPEIQHEHKVTV